MKKFDPELAVSDTGVIFAFLKNSAMDGTWGLSKKILLEATDPPPPRLTNGDILDGAATLSTSLSRISSLIRSLLVLSVKIVSKSLKIES